MMRKISVLFSLGLLSCGLCAAEMLPVVEVAPRLVALTLPADAMVEAVQQSVVAAQMPGRVLEVRVDAGKLVKQGEVLMRIDAREAAGNAEAAEAQYRNARVNYERTRSLVQKKFLSPASLDKAKSDYEAAAANRSAAAASQSHALIVAPMNGVVARRHLELGEMAVPGKPLFTLYAPGGLRVKASVPQTRLAEMRGAKAAKIEFPELGLWIDAVEVTVLPTVDAVTKTAEVRVGLPATPEVMGVVTPGMFARVHFVVGEARKMTVPAKAVVRRGEVAGVYVQAVDGRLSLRQLRLGEAMVSGEIEVLAGLTAGEKVVTDPVKAGIQLKGSKE